MGTFDTKRYIVSWLYKGTAHWITVRARNEDEAKRVAAETAAKDTGRSEPFEKIKDIMIADLVVIRK